MREEEDEEERGERRVDGEKLGDAPIGDAPAAAAAAELVHLFPCLRAETNEFIVEREADATEGCLLQAARDAAEAGAPAAAAVIERIFVGV